MDLDVTSPKQLNRRLFLKQLAVDLCSSERRILFRAQYVKKKSLFLLQHDNSYLSVMHSMFIIINCWLVKAFISTLTWQVLNPVTNLFCQIRLVRPWLLC